MITLAAAVISILLLALIVYVFVSGLMSIF